MLLSRAVPNHRSSIVFHKSPVWHSCLHIRIPCACCMLNKCHSRVFEVLSLSPAYLCSFSGQSRNLGPDAIPHVLKFVFLLGSTFFSPVFSSLTEILASCHFRAILFFYLHPDLALYYTFLIFLHCPGSVSAKSLQSCGIPS